MAENDIYNNQARFEHFKDNLDKLLIPPEKKNDKRSKYYCKNSDNLKYFTKIFLKMGAKDLSYVRRLRLANSLLFILNYTEKELSTLDRDDIDIIISYMHQHYKSVQSKTTFIKHIKYIWKNILPEKDERGRSDETIVPYVVRHLSGKIERSKQKMRNDRFTFEEFEQILAFFSNDSRMQLFLSLSLDSIARPQEILYRKLKDIEVYDNYAKIRLSDHGKEGIGIIQCIDSFPYLAKWLNEHPQKDNPNAYIFINLGYSNFGTQMKNVNINKKLKYACQNLGINKTVTCYSFKRNGVTFKRLRGDSDVEIQHAARWTSTNQLKTYDMSTQEDAFKIQLIKRGLIKPDDKEYEKYTPEKKVCRFCDTSNLFTNKFCSNCKRPLDKTFVISSDYQKQEEIDNLKSEINILKTVLDQRKPYDELVAKLLENREIKKLVEQAF